MTAVAIDETSYRRGHKYLTLVADAQQRKVVFVTEGKDAKTVARSPSTWPSTATAEQIAAASIDMSPAFIKGVTETCPTPASPSTSSTSLARHDRRG